MTGLTQDQRDELRKKAEAARGSDIIDLPKHPRTELAAAASPDVVLALLDAADEADLLFPDDPDGEELGWREVAINHATEKADLRRQLDEAREELAACTACNKLLGEIAEAAEKDVATAVARLAAVEALADEWTSDKSQWHGTLAYRLRAVLGEGPTVGSPSDQERDEDGDANVDYMCPNCVTPWKCNGPHLDGEPPETATCGAEHPTNPSVVPCMVSKGHSGNHWSWTGCAGSGMVWHTDALTAPTDETPRPEAVRRWARLGDTASPTDDEAEEDRNGHEEGCPLRMEFSLASCFCGRPKLPTAPGEVILATRVRGENAPEGEPWKLILRFDGYWYGEHPSYIVKPVHIEAWSPARVVSEDEWARVIEEADDMKFSMEAFRDANAKTSGTCAALRARVAELEAELKSKDEFGYALSATNRDNCARADAAEARVKELEADQATADELRRGVLLWAGRFRPGDVYDPEDFRDLEAAMGGTVENIERRWKSEADQLRARVAELEALTKDHNYLLNAAGDAEEERDKWMERCLAQESALNFETTCLSCAKNLQTGYDATARAEAAEARVAELQSELDRMRESNGPVYHDEVCAYFVMQKELRKQVDELVAERDTLKAERPAPRPIEGNKTGGWRWPW